MLDSVTEEKILENIVYSILKLYSTALQNPSSSTRVRVQY